VKNLKVGVLPKKKLHAVVDEVLVAHDDGHGRQLLAAAHHLGVPILPGPGPGLLIQLLDRRRSVTAGQSTWVAASATDLSDS
jgi:hypothetical protein